MSRKERKIYRDEMEKLYKHKIINVLGSNGKA